MFFKKKKEETIVEPNSKAYSEYVWAFNMLGGNTLAMENLFHKFKSHEKTTEQDVEETKPQMTKLQQQAKLILENSHYKLLAQGDPKSQLHSIEEKEIIVSANLDAAVLKETAKDVKRVHRGLHGEKCYAMAATQILESYSEERLVLEAPDLLNKKFTVIDVYIHNLDLSHKYARCDLKIKVPATNDEKHTKELKALDILFSGKSGESHLLAVKEEIELLNNNIKEFIEQTNCFIRMAEDEEAFKEDLEEIYSADEELENVRNSFFGIKPTI